MAESRFGIVVLGNQLFPPAELDEFADCPAFLCEDVGLCTYVKHHQQKIVLFLAAMREYADALRERGFDVSYRELGDADETYEDRLAEFVDGNDLTGLVHFEIEDHFFDRRIAAFCDEHDLERRVLSSPMFLTSRNEFEAYVDDAKRPFMAEFYKRQRRRLRILVDDDGSPRGGQWSFDEANRKKLPKSVEPPSLPEAGRGTHAADVIELVGRRFADHPGSAEDFWWPVTRRSALAWLRDFVEQRLENFGDYQDAISTRSETAFHSVVSPLLNLGLITPQDVVDRVLERAREKDIPLNSLEGFVRQVIGWREFIRGIYHNYDDEQREANFFDHRRSLTHHWYDATTGIPPLDHAIRTAMKLGWTHHISRLMVIGNLMNLCEIEPRQAHDWFMETHVDSSDWVMGPNVYGMALYSDGGIFATKPYICGSNYLLKMSDHAKGDWCDTVDGLYWRFVDKHRDFFEGNQRLSMMTRTVDRLKDDRRKRIFDAAEAFLDDKTGAP